MAFTEEWEADSDCRVKPGEVTTQEEDTKCAKMVWIPEITGMREEAGPGARGRGAEADLGPSLDMDNGCFLALEITGF